MKNLWLYQGESEFDNRTGLQYCSARCMKTRAKKDDGHKEKVFIIQQCICEKFYLYPISLYQEPRVGGASLLAQLNNFTAREYLSPGSQTVPGKVLKGTCKITTWNMQGAINMDQITLYLNTSKPAILCIQEAKINEDNKHIFKNKNYNAYLDLKTGDLVTFVRKDLKSHIIKDSAIKEITYTIVHVKAEGKIIHIINIYARDGKLQHSHLTYLMEKYKNTILAGDLNAKHIDLLQHTQRTPYNRNGIQLKTYLEGRDRIHTVPPPVSIHNVNDPTEWTHTTPDRKWAQIDYILSHSTITHKLIETQYEYTLISDHQGLSVRAPELFPETHTTSRTKFVPDWRTYDEWKYKFITEMEMEAAIINGNWYELPTHKKVEVFTNIQKYAFENSIKIP